MDTCKFDRQLRLVLLLTQNTDFTIEELCEKLSMSRRTIFRYIDALRDMGFHVIKENSIYRLDKSSPFFKKLKDIINFSEDEAIAMGQILNSVNGNSPQIRTLRNKLSRLYDYKVLAKYNVNEKLARNISVLYEAIKQERVVILKNYTSLNSDQQSNRIVEPFLFHNGNSEVRCFEISTGMNKTFRVSRIETVELLDLYWSNKEKHQAYYTDLFSFSGEVHFPVTLRMGRKATNLLIEEYPDAIKYLTLEPDGHNLLRTEVCSYKGIGRFVLSVFEDIEIVDSPEFEQYIKDRIQLLTQKVWSVQ